MVFNSSKFLQSQGWEGTGSALRKGGRARPVSVVQKKTLAGVGKDTYNGFEWWDAVFAGVAKKLNKTGMEPVKEHRTSTGILSPLPPPLTHSACSEAPKASTSTDYIGQAKQEAAKARLYRGFLRGQVLEGNLEEEQKAELVVEVIQPQKDKKRRRTQTDEGQEREETKEERRARRALKKANKLGLVESPSEQVEALDEEKPRKKRRKEV